MRFALIALVLFSFHLLSFGQKIYTTNIYPRFLPGHLHIVVTIDRNFIRYELFNHWYSGRYAELRQVIINPDSLDLLNKSSDSLTIKILGDKVQVRDKRYGINKKFRNKNLCASPETMRKISFAYKLSSKNGLDSHALYTEDDLKLNEIEFGKKVIANLDKFIK